GKRHPPRRGRHRWCSGWRSAGRRRSPLRAGTWRSPNAVRYGEHQVMNFVAETAAGASICLLLFRDVTLLRVIMDFQEQAAAVRLERAVHRPGWAAGIGAGREAFAPFSRGIVADREIALDQIDLFPIIVNKGRRGEHLRRETQEPRPAAALARLVERPGEDLLFDPGGIAGRGAPAGRHIDGMEFAMGLVDGHGCLLLPFSL